MGMGMMHCKIGIAHSEMLYTIRVDDVIPYIVALMNTLLH